MKRNCYSLEQIVAAMKLHEQGTAALNICRKLGIADATFYRSRQQYGGRELSAVWLLLQTHTRDADA